MSRIFCTLKEAAETLHASEDQIQALLERGLLHEFREGPHRLLKEEDVGALASVGQHRVPTSPPASSPEDRGRRTGLRSPPSSVVHPAPSGIRPPSAVRRDAPGLSVRQWFWMGLVQDRPLVIALLASLILLGLSALAAGLCFAAEAF